MAKYTQTKLTTGNWVKAAEIKDGTRAKILEETVPRPSQFKDKNDNIKNQDVTKVRFESMKEAVNVALNMATINGLVSAFGDESKEWIGKVLTAETEKMRVGGKAVVALYLIPEGYERIDDANGYAVILKKGEVVEKTADEQYDQMTEDAPDPSEIPF